MDFDVFIPNALKWTALTATGYWGFGNVLDIPPNHLSILAGMIGMAAFLYTLGGKKLNSKSLSKLNESETVHLTTTVPIYIQRKIKASLGPESNCFLVQPSSTAPELPTPRHAQQFYTHYQDHIMQQQPVHIVKGGRQTQITGNCANYHNNEGVPPPPKHYMINNGMSKQRRHYDQQRGLNIRDLVEEEQDNIREKKERARTRQDQLNVSLTKGRALRNRRNREPPISLRRGRNWRKRQEQKPELHGLSMTAPIQTRLTASANMPYEDEDIPELLQLTDHVLGPRRAEEIQDYIKAQNEDPLAESIQANNFERESEQTREKNNGSTMSVVLGLPTGLNKTTGKVTPTPSLLDQSDTQQTVAQMNNMDWMNTMYAQQPSWMDPNIEQMNPYNWRPQVDQMSSHDKSSSYTLGRAEKSMFAILTVGFFLLIIAHLFRHINFSNGMISEMLKIITHSNRDGDYTNPEDGQPEARYFQNGIYYDQNGYPIMNYNPAVATDL